MERDIEKILLTEQQIQDRIKELGEILTAEYEGDQITIGFKSTFLVEILSNIETTNILLELADSTRAGVFKPIYESDQDSDTLMLLMPMMINA